MSKAQYIVPDNRPWFKLYDSHISKHLDYVDEPLYYFIDRAAEEKPDNIALNFFGANITYREYRKLINQFAHALQKAGIQKGDRVLIMAVNCPQVLIALYGSMKAGAIPIPLNPLYTAKELEYFFNDLKPRIVLTPDSFFNNVNIAAKTTPQIEKIISTNISDYFPPLKGFLAKLTKKVPVFDCPDSIDFNEFIKVSPDYEKVSINPKEDTALMVYTGGTTGEPKGVCLTHFNLVSDAMSFDEWHKQIKSDSSLLVVPLFHIYGCGLVINFTNIRAGKLVIVPKFHTKDTLSILKKEKVSGLFCVPAIYSAFVKYYNDNPNEPKLNDVTLCGSGSAPISSYIWKELQGIVPNTYLGEGYGLSESCPGTTIDPVNKNYVKEIGSVGIPSIDTDIKIVDLITKTEVGPGISGEIVINSPSIFKEYWNKPEKTKEVLKDGWFFSGDIGRMDENGVIFIEGRIDDMINVRGEKVWPREVEKVLEKHPKVLDVAVIGVPSDYYGQIIKACVVLKEGVQSSEEELIDYCKKSLVEYKVPKMIEFFKELPKSNLGKTLHSSLRKREVNNKNK